MTWVKVLSTNVMGEGSKKFLSAGYNDVSWHNDEILTPNMDKFAREGMILENAYMEPTCTPSRAALMTGYYPMHTGSQVQF